MKIQLNPAIILLCPSCQRTLEQNHCPNCGESFSQTLGILDLRWPRPPSPTTAEETLVAKLVEQFETKTYRELVTLRFQNLDAPPEFLTLYHDYQTNLQTRGKSMMHMFQARLSEYYEIPDCQLALDIGCGVGTSTAVLANQFAQVIGIDPSLPDLILAQKYCQEQQIENTLFVQAFAQHLPLQDNLVSYAVALNVIEHLFDVENAFAEFRRILKPGGCFCGDSRNRYDLFFPEPHAQLHWVGLFPRRFQPWYVRTFKKRSYTSAHLLSWLELRRFAKHIFDQTTITYPLVSAYGQPVQTDKWIHLLEKIPVFRHLALIIFPSHLLLAKVENPLSTAH